MIRYAWLLIIGLVAAGAPLSASGQTSKVAARGAKLWNATCNRCHNQRSPTERTDRQWDVIVTHMRTRANLTKEEAQAIAAFLKQSNKSENQTAKRSSARAASDSAAVAQPNAGAPDTRGQVGQIRGKRGFPLRPLASSVLGRRLLKRFPQTGSSGQQARSQ